MPNKRKTNKVDVVIGSRLREIRKSRQMSQIDLSEKVDLTFQQIQKYEKGTNRIPVSRLYQMAGALDVSPEYFFANLPSLRPVPAPTERLPPQGFAETPEGLELIASYARIPNRSIRRSVLDLIKALAIGA